MMSSKTFKVLVLFTILSATSCEDGWTGKWFPENATEIIHPLVKSVTPTREWKGNWFPRQPPKYESANQSFEQDRIMGVPNSNCDDGETNLGNDFDPKNENHAMSYMCLEKTYKADYEVEPIKTVFNVPKFYTPVHKCMNETITYEQRIPTLGYHRPLWAAFGEYDYLPPQRWLHNLEHGAIVAIYHPCANKNLVDHFRKVIKGCLYRHIITPYRKLTAERPFALAAWGVSLELSVVDTPMIVEFVKSYAKTGPEKVSRDGQYKMMLIEAAKIITDVDDSSLCPNVSK